MPRKPAHEQFDALKAIENCAFALFGRYGYEGVSIGDIARGAKLSKGALYWHFQGKEELYLHCLKRLHALFDRYIFDPMRSENDGVRAVLLLFRGLGALVEDPQVEKGIAGYWQAPSTAEVDRIMAQQRAFEDNALRTLTAALTRGKEQGRIDLGGDLEDMSRATISLVEAVVLPLRHRTPDEIHRMLGVLARTLFRAYSKSDDLLALTRSL
jgi:TetR/AcrR family acrAB operon transcriptional repressor